MNADRDAERFGQLLRGAGEVLDVTVSPARIALYFRTLQRFEFEIIEVAFGRFLESEASKFGFPKPVHIIEIIEGSQSEQEDNAWMAVNDAIRKIGAYNSVIVADPSLGDAIVRVFGSWVRCCEEANESNNYIWDQRRKAFVTAYRLARRIQRRPGAPPTLLGGRAEIENRTNGRFPSRQPYGAILLDGRVETRYLDINARTGLPAVRLSDALALPEALSQRLLPAVPEQETGTELIGEGAVITLTEAFERLLRSRSFPSREDRQRLPRTDREPTAEERFDEERKALLRRQAEDDGSNVSHATIRTVRASQDASTELADRTANHGGGSSKGRTGVPLRESDRAGLARGSGVAGVPDSVRAGGSGVRKRGERGNRGVHDPKGKKNPARAGHAGSSRRKT